MVSASGTLGETGEQACVRGGGLTSRGKFREFLEIRGEKLTQPGGCLSVISSTPTSTLMPTKPFETSRCRPPGQPVDGVSDAAATGRIRPFSAKLRLTNRSAFEHDYGYPARDHLRARHATASSSSATMKILASRRGQPDARFRPTGHRFLMSAGGFPLNGASSPPGGWVDPGGAVISGCQGRSGAPLDRLLLFGPGVFERRASMPRPRWFFRDVVPARREARGNFYDPWRTNDWLSFDVSRDGLASRASCGRDVGGVLSGCDRAGGRHSPGPRPPRGDACRGGWHRARPRPCAR